MTDLPPPQHSSPTPNPMPGYPPYPPYPPYAYVALVNPNANLALAFGIVFPPLAIYFAKKAKEQIAQTGENGAEMATAGAVLGWTFTILYGLMIVVCCGAATVFLSSE